jgi:hypothetical protein
MLARYTRKVTCELQHQAGCVDLAGGGEHTYNNHDKDAFEVVFVSARVLSICTKSLCIQQVSRPLH